MLNATPKPSKWIRDIIEGEYEVIIDGGIYTYYELPDEYEPDLPGFLGFKFYEEGDQKHYCLFIAKGVPVEFRRFMLAHEVRERLDPEEFGCCRRALERELAEVPQELMAEYLPYRHRQFVALEKYYAPQREKPTITALYKGIVESLEYLTRIVEPPPA